MPLFRSFSRLLVTTCAIAATVGLPSFTSAAQPPQTTLIFNAHDNSNYPTYAMDINKSGTVLGYYYDANYNAYGFLRSADGIYTDLVYPGSTQTFAKAMNERGTIVGNTVSDTGLSVGWSYDPTTREFTLLQAPGALATFVQDITEDGTIVGWASIYKASRYQGDAGFVLRDGVYHLVAVPDATQTDIRAANGRGQVGGTYVNTTGQHTFTMSKGGTVTDITVKNEAGFFSTLYAMDNRGNFVGTCPDSNFTLHGCYYDQTSGTLKMFMVDGLSQTNPFSLKAGAIVGFGNDETGNLRGFVVPLSVVQPAGHGPQRH